MNEKEFIAKARADKYSEEEIWEYLTISNPGTLRSLQDGYRIGELKQYYGLDLTDRETAEEKRQKLLKKLEPVLKDIKTYPSQAIKPFKIAAETWGEEVEAGKKMMKEPKLWKKGVGALQYTFAPITGAARSIGSAVEEALAVPLPEGVAKFGGQLAEEATYFIPPTRIARTLKLASKVPKAIKPSEKAFKELIESGVGATERTKKFKAPLSWVEKHYPKRIQHEEIPKIFRGDERLLSKGVSERLIDDATLAAEQSLAGNFDTSRRIFHQIAEHLKIGEIQIEDLPDILKKYQLTPAQFAQEYEHTISRAGRVLSYHSRAAKRLRAVFKDNLEATKILEQAIAREKEGRYVSDILFETWAKFDQPRRAFLVSQLATATRNAWSQAGRITIGTFDDVLQAYTGGAGTREAIKTGWTTFTAFYNRLAPSGRKRLLNVLQTEGPGALHKARLISQPVHEVAMGSKAAHVVNIFNRTQEYFFRKLAFESKLRQLLKKEGLDFSTVNPAKIPDSIYKDSVEYALEMTFAASAKGKFAQDFIRVWSRSPMTTINPFPRFAFANALPFIMEHSPLGYLRAFSPETLKALASGNPKRFTRAASRATIGTVFMESAWHIRQSKHAGDKWYHIKVGEPDEKGDQRMIDVRAYAPLSTYLFVADAFLHPERLKGKDYAEAAIGLNRIAGSGLVLIDLLRAKKVESVKDIMGRMAGAYIGSYTVPAKTAKDILAGTIAPEEAVYKEKRISPVVAPALENLPYAGRVLPEAISPITTRRVKAEKPLKKQFFGLTETIRTPITREIDKTGLGWSSVYPSTGVKEANYEMAKYMGPLVEKFAPSIILTNPGYNEGSIVKKRLILKGFFKLIRQAAKVQLQTYNPTLAAKISVERISDDEKKYIEETTGIKVDKLFQ